ncbi:MAG: Tat pathway signal protein [Phenylobacterium zucineum]|nr:MAG: Tat pathway signal protein [Phenylobacterium zucineum]
MNRRCFIMLTSLLGLAPNIAWASGKTAEGGKAKKPDGPYVAVGLITASIMRDNGRRSVLAVDTGIDVPDPALFAKAEKLTPRLQAAYVQSLQTYAVGLLPGRVPDADYISRELQKQTDAVVGRPGARLLLGSVILN